MTEQRPEYITDALEMIGVMEPKKIIQEISGFVPVFDVLLDHYKNPLTPLIFGRMWQFCQMEDNVCKASLSTIANKLNLDKATIARHIEKLVEDGYLIDLTPGIRNRPHVYADGRRVIMKSSTVAQSNATVAQSNTGVAQSNATVAESQLNKPINKQLNKPSNKPKRNSEVSLKGVEVAMVQGRAVTEDDFQASFGSEDHTALDAFERAMGYNPLPWDSERQLGRLKRFLQEKSVEEIKTFAAWSKSRYSTAKPAKIRQFPKLAMDLWPLAFEAMNKDDSFYEKLRRA